MIEAILGIAVGVLTIVVARIIRGQRWLYALGLLTLPGLYASFAFVTGEKAVGVTELIYGVPFILVGLVLTFVSVRRSAVVVGAFWILHGVYDVTHHLFFTNPGVPRWYPVFCFTVDVVIGAYVLGLSRRLSDGNLRQA